MNIKNLLVLLYSVTVTFVSCKKRKRATSLLYNNHHPLLQIIRFLQMQERIKLLICLTVL